MTTERPSLATPYRTHTAGELRASDAGTQASLAGWVHRRRDHGQLIFLDLRDRHGITQVVVDRTDQPEAHATASRVRNEFVVRVRGEVARRLPGTENPKLLTGDIELRAREVEILNEARTPPFYVNEPDAPIDESLRLKYRYLDIRREAMQQRLLLRSRLVQAIRHAHHSNGFVEVETPTLIKSTPEGARDFVVPSRLQPGSVYALPQSPQQLKQILMVGGIDRYFQIARCYRDEDLRGDRQPEFTQLDLEMAFVEEDDVYELIDPLLQRVLALGEIEVELPLERITYDEAMLRYGSDRPDRRLGVEIVELTEIFRGSRFKVFGGAVESGGVVRALRARGDFPRSRIDKLEEKAKALGAKGLAWAVVEAGSWRSPIAKFLSDDEIARATAAVEAREGDVILFGADSAEMVARVLGGLRPDVAEGEPEGHDCFWVVDFPMFERNEEEGRWDAIHHPFTAPSGDLDADPGTWRSRAYDVVLDGWELGGGSIRINRPDVQQKVFDALGIAPEEARERFGFLLEALAYGAPPHGGIAFGIDRIVALLARRDSIRDAIAFPKAASGADPMTGAPAGVDERQLRELGIRLDQPPPSRN